MNWRILIVGAALAAAGMGSTAAQADVITFENLTGPSFASQTTAGDVTETTSIGDVTFSNGAILTDEASLPADTTSVFYNSFFLSGSSGASETITFPVPIQNFFLNLYNGQLYDETFTVSDNTGVSTTVTIASNTASGVSLISFPAVGTVVTITTSDTTGYDFSIDNVGFNQATPGVPEPATWAMMLLGVGGIGLFARRRARTATAAAA